MSTKRVTVLKTYKIYIGGQFPRTESGRYYTAMSPKGEHLANMCLCSRKDVRDAIGMARGAFGGWSSRSAFNRGQILYRVAEMLEGRKAQFIEELMQQGSGRAAAEKEVSLSIDRLIYYSGWCDKYQQIFSSVNPVSSSHFNFSALEPMGVVTIVAPQNNSLIGLVSTMAAVIAGGNTCVILASQTKPLCAVTFAEVLNTSDLPGGVVNILTGKVSELLSHLSNHMDVNAVCYCGEDADNIRMVRENAAINVKRPIIYENHNWMDENTQSPYFINDFQEVKTTWHPIENIGGAKAGY
jgi:acyl-CoA reductase-like NAD-dependent aldehyde dehydrogenase